MAGSGLSESILCEKARTTADIVQGAPSASDNGEIFCATKEWLPNFKVRTGVHGIIQVIEAAGADKKGCCKLQVPL